MILSALVVIRHTLKITPARQLKIPCFCPRNVNYVFSSCVFVSASIESEKMFGSPDENEKDYANANVLKFSGINEDKKLLVQHGLHDRKYDFYT